MPTGKPLNRDTIFVLKNGTAVVDWDENIVQDLFTGDFFRCKKSEISHVIRDDELEILRRAGRVESYDSRHVYVYTLPEPPRRMID